MMQAAPIPKMKLGTVGRTLQRIPKCAYVILIVASCLTTCSTFHSAKAATQMPWQRPGVSENGGKKWSESDMINSHLESIEQNSFLPEAENIVREGAMDIQQADDVESQGQLPQVLQKARRWLENANLAEKANRFGKNSIAGMKKFAGKVREHRLTGKLKEALKKEEIQAKLLELAAASAVMTVGSFFTGSESGAKQILGSALFLAGTLNAAKAVAGLSKVALKGSSVGEKLRETGRTYVNHTRRWFDGRQRGSKKMSVKNSRAEENY